MIKPQSENIEFCYYILLKKSESLQAPGDSFLKMMPMKKRWEIPQKQGLMVFQKLKQYPEALPLMNCGLKTVYS